MTLASRIAQLERRLPPPGRQDPHRRVWESFLALPAEEREVLLRGLARCVRNSGTDPGLYPPLETLDAIARNAPALYEAWTDLAVEGANGGDVTSAALAYLEALGAAVDSGAIPTPGRLLLEGEAAAAVLAYHKGSGEPLPEGGPLATVLFHGGELA